MHGALLWHHVGQDYTPVSKFGEERASATAAHSAVTSRSRGEPLSVIHLGYKAIEKKKF
jgi:hypothetical protein